jgi:cell division protease FtsH
MFVEILLGILSVLFFIFIAGLIFVIHKANRMIKNLAVPEFNPTKEKRDEISEISTENPNIIKPKHKKTWEEEIEFTDIGGLEEAKRVFTEIADYLNFIQSFKKTEQKQAIPLRRKFLKCYTGIILSGPSGVGKTMICRAFATHAKANFFVTTGSELGRANAFGHSGAEQNLKQLFERAKAEAPSIIFIDEIDTLGTRQSTSFSILLTLLDGFHKTKKPGGNPGLEDENLVILIGATNKLSSLDPALIRPGRIDQIIEIPCPSFEDRKKILNLHARNLDLFPQPSQEIEGEWSSVIAKNCSGCSGAELAAIIRESVRFASRKNLTKLTVHDILTVAEQCTRGNPWKIQNPEIRERIAIHEAGHTVIYKILQYEQEGKEKEKIFFKRDMLFKLDRVTLISRKNVFGANIFSNESEYSIFDARPTKYSIVTDCSFGTLNQALDWICVLWGGCCAEEIQYGDYSFGVTGDLEEITKVARYCINSLLYDQKDQKEKFKSDPVEELISKKREQTKQIIMKNHGFLQIVKKELLQKETLTDLEVTSLFETWREKDST